VNWDAKNINLNVLRTRPKSPKIYNNIYCNFEEPPENNKYLFYASCVDVKKLLNINKKR